MCRLLSVSWSCYATSWTEFFPAFIRRFASSITRALSQSRKSVTCPFYLVLSNQNNPRYELIGANEIALTLRSKVYASMSRDIRRNTTWMALTFFSTFLLFGPVTVPKFLSFDSLITWIWGNINYIGDSTMTEVALCYENVYCMSTMS